MLHSRSKLLFDLRISVKKPIGDHLCPLLLSFCPLAAARVHRLPNWATAPTWAISAASDPLDVFAVASYCSPFRFRAPSWPPGPVLSLAGELLIVGNGQPPHRLLCPVGITALPLHLLISPVQSRSDGSQSPYHFAYRFYKRDSLSFQNRTHSPWRILRIRFLFLKA